MKSVLTLALATTLLASNAFAIEVNGAKAQNLFNALKNAGAQVRQFTEAASVSVSNVRGGTTVTGRGVYAHVEMTDNLTGRVVRAEDNQEITTPALSVVKAMEDAGVKPEVYPGGLKIDAKSIECDVAHMGARGFYNCKIKE